MSIKHDAFAISAWTSGTGIVLGTNIDLAGIVSGSATTTVTIVANGATAVITTGNGIQFGAPVALVGPVTGTSSGGSFAVLRRQRVV